MRAELNEVRAQHAAGESEIVQLKNGIADFTVQNVQLSSELAQAREVWLFLQKIFLNVFFLLIRC